MNTAKRQGVGFHSEEYHQKLAGYIPNKIFLAKYKGQTLASAMLFVHEKNAYYAFGGNSFEHTQVMASTLLVWEMAKKLSNHYFFGPSGITDPYAWTFDDKDHTHLILYQGVEIVGYAHIQLWPDHRAALRIFVIDEPYRQHGLGSQFLQMFERWLKIQGFHSLHDEATPDGV